MSSPDSDTANVPGGRLLVVEDDLKLGRALRRGLEQEGYVVDVAEDGVSAVAKASRDDFQVIVLDVVLPDIDGFVVCERLRRRERWAPVLMLTARSEVRDRIHGLDGGADDYMVKPFDFGELLARVRALTRRGPSEHTLVMAVGDLQIDRAAHTVTRGGRTVELTPREFGLLEFLARRPGRPVSRVQLIDHVWDAVPDVSPNVVAVYIGYLRKKLDRLPGRRLIHTVRGVGYRLDPG